MVSEGAKIRAQIDTESVRAVMLVNGGGSIAMLTLLPSVMGTPLVAGMLLTLACWLLGLTLAVIHNVLRRKCSNLYEAYWRKGKQPPPGEPLFCFMFGMPRALVVPKQPWICWWSWKYLHAAIGLFFIGGAVMVIAGFANLDVLTASGGR